MVVKRMRTPPLSVTNFRTGVAIAALMIGTPAMAEPHEVKVRPPVCETVTVAKVYPGCAKSEAMGEGVRADGDAWGCSGAGAGGIDYTNGKHQNGEYANVPAMEASRPGDRVRLCLVSKMVNCPPGDDRGHVYTALNLRTHGKWRKPDSSHSCGGA